MSRFVFALLLSMTTFQSNALASEMIEPSQAFPEVHRVAILASLNEIQMPGARVRRVTAETGKYQVGSFGDYSIRVEMWSLESRQTRTCEGSIMIRKDIIRKDPVGGRQPSDTLLERKGNILTVARVRSLRCQ